MDISLLPIIDQANYPLRNSRDRCRSSFFHGSAKSIGNNEPNIFINAPPKGCEKEYKSLFTNGVVEFLIDLIVEFNNEIEELYNRRLRRKLELRSSRKVPQFSKSITSLDGNWKVSPVGQRLENRRLELGDVSPSDLPHFIAALKSPVQGIQVDFDDGHCPTWRNQIVGLHNVGLAVRGLIPGVPKISEAPTLMLRPRAWNMVEKNISINGRLVPGPLVDFALLIYHNGRRILEETGVGASFYLSKLEGAAEAKFWNDIFSWTETRLEFPRGSVKACVLIENILSAFEMDDILWELRERSLGLNCGIWDYAASIISKFGTNDENFLLPDRKKYVNSKRTFLRSYMQLVVNICHKRGIHATGGMAANLLNGNNPSASLKVMRSVYEAKLAEIDMGLDGFLVYDLGLVRSMNKLWCEHGGSAKNQINEFRANSQVNVTVQDLLSMPKGGVTSSGLEHNIRIGILFVLHWLKGKGHFAYEDCIEDSATAEISRSQVWQWIKYGATLEDRDERVTRTLVKNKASEVARQLQKNYGGCFESNRSLFTALDLFLDLVNQRDFPEFITSYLEEKHVYRNCSSNL